MPVPVSTVSSRSSLSSSLSRTLPCAMPSKSFDRGCSGRAVVEAVESEVAVLVDAHTSPGGAQV
jgi:hypothetical protein